MRKYLSVFGLFARSSVYKILGVLLIMCSAEIGIFAVLFRETRIAYESGIGIGIEPIELILDNTLFRLCFGLAFIAITVLLCLSGTEYASKTGYTLKRLSISEKKTFFCQAAYNIFIYLFLWALQLVVCFGLCSYYIVNAPEECVSNQTLFLAFYRSSFLHTLLPLSDLPLWIRNVFLAAALGFAAAEFPYKQRRKKFAPSIIALALFTIVFFSREIGDITNCVIVIVIALLVCAEMLYTVLRKETDNES